MTEQEIREAFATRWGYQDTLVADWTRRALAGDAEAVAELRASHRLLRNQRRRQAAAAVTPLRSATPVARKIGEASPTIQPKAQAEHNHDHDVALLAVILAECCAVCLEEALARLHPLGLVEVRDVVVAAVHRHVPSATRAWAG